MVSYAKDFKTYSKQLNTTILIFNWQVLFALTAENSNDMIYEMTERGSMMYQPLADLLRPQTLDEVFGQEHILSENAVLRRLIDSGKVPNMVFYGPSGTGKTTVANIIAKQTNRTLFKLNATTASTADIKQIVAQLETFMAPNGVLLYLDEIQSFNKKQQQS